MISIKCSHCNNSIKEPLNNKPYILVKHAIQAFFQNTGLIFTQIGTVKYYAQIHLQFWQNSVCTGQGNLPLIT